jgi:hypothetical protein
MGNVYMQEPGCQQPVLLPSPDLGYPEFIADKKGGVTKTPEGNKHIDSDYGNGCQMHIHGKHD